MANGGWIKKHRAAADHPLLQEFDAAGLWDYLLLQAAFEPHQVRLNGHMMTLQRGQVAVSVRALGERGGISYKRTRTIVDNFRAQGMIKIGAARGKAFSLITICNYELYQSDEEVEGAASGAAEAQEGRSKGAARAKEIRREEGKKIIHRFALNLSRTRSARASLPLARGYRRTGSPPKPGWPMPANMASATCASTVWPRTS